MTNKKSRASCSAFFILLPRFRLIIKQQDAAADEDEGDDEVDGVDSAGFGQEDKREDSTEDGGREGEDRHAGNRIILQQHAPQRVRNRREKGEVDEYNDTRRVRQIYLAAKERADSYHKRAAEDKLISANDHGILILGKSLHKHR